MKAAAPCAVLLFGVACVSPPHPTAAALALERNPRAEVQGRVLDTLGRAATGLRVQAIPHGKDIPWSPPASTDSQGRFLLTLFAPAQYSFVLRQADRSVVTDDPRDPSRVVLEVHPGEHRQGIELLLLREEWDKILRDDRN